MISWYLRPFLKLFQSCTIAFRCVLYFQGYHVTFGPLSSFCSPLPSLYSEFSHKKMAFQDLVNGDCSGVNAMSKFTQHLNQDRSLQRVSSFSIQTPSRQPVISFSLSLSLSLLQEGAQRPDQPGPSVFYLNSFAGLSIPDTISFSFDDSSASFAEMIE